MAQANVSRHLGLMYQAGLLARRRDGTQIFYRVADPVYVELCRTVSAQVAASHRHPPANQKEEASV